ncbi:hypothetical protein [Klebsiella pneumoniae]|uniref:hypothetical protein n=1 Tax=Klebsiella pneumoniae TaxID=573 RepID=UPI0024DE38D6|nr:hypothetical protein [Klebsiella pneumoniae]
MLAEHLGLLIQSDPEYGTETWREMALLNGMMGLHTDRIMRFELQKAKADLTRARLELLRLKKRLPARCVICWLVVVRILDSSGRRGNMATLMAE